MTKTSEEMKNLVEEFIKVTNINYEDQTEKSERKARLLIGNFMLEQMS